MTKEKFGRGKNPMRSRRILQAFIITLTLTLVWGAGLSFSKERFHEFILDNGMKVILEENRASPVVALQAWVKVGSGDERDEEAGMSHFIEHMLFKGTEKRKVREMAKEIESMGGYINAYTSYDQTVYHIALASRYIDTGLDILSDAVQHSTFDSTELEREREVVLEEIRMGQDDPSRRLFNQTMGTLYQHHPYRRPVIGYEKTVQSITRDQMISFFKKWYTPRLMVFIAVGDFDLKDMEKKMREVFKDFKPSPRIPSERVREPEQTSIRSAIADGNFKETYLQIGLSISSARGEDTPALDALSHILGGGEASRLAQKVKLEKGLVHSISTSSYTPKDPGAFIIGATLSPENLEKAIGAILGEINLLQKEGVSAEELHRVRVSVESGLVYDRQTVQGEARKRGYYEVIAGDTRFEDEYIKKVSLLQPEDIRKVVEKYFKPSRWVISILAPSEKIESIKNISLNSIIEGQKSAEISVEKREEASASRTVLENGMRLIIKESRSVPLVTLQASFLAGVRFEEEAQNGINNFIAVILTKGTRAQNSLQIAKKVEKMAGSVNGFSGYNSFGLTFNFLSHHFEEAFDLFADILLEPSFDEQEMEKRRRPILAAIRQQEDNLSGLAFRLFRKALYEKHPYRMDLLGTLDTVQRLTRDDLNEYYQRIVVPENMVLTIVGDVNQEQALSAARKAFGKFSRKGFTLPAVPSVAPLREKKRAEIYKKKEQAHFVLGFLGTTLQHKDRYAIDVLGAALSGQGGRLFHELRDRESLAYALTFIANPNLDAGFLGVYMGSHPDKLEKAISAVLRELRKVKEEGLTEEEVARAKKYLIGNFEIGLQTNGAQANQISLDELYGLGFDHYRKHPLEIEKVTREDVHRVAKDYFNLDAYALAIVRPPMEKTN